MSRLGSHSEVLFGRTSALCDSYRCVRMVLAHLARQIDKINCHIEALDQICAFDPSDEELSQLHLEQVAWQSGQFILLKVELHCQSGWVLRAHCENGRQAEERHAFEDGELFEL